MVRELTGWYDGHQGWDAIRATCGCTSRGWAPTETPSTGRCCWFAANGRPFGDDRNVPTTSLCPPLVTGGRSASGSSRFWPRASTRWGAGVIAVAAARLLLPYALAFAAGEMIFVVVGELIPESKRGHHADLATSALLLGFAMMIALDVAFG